MKKEHRQKFESEKENIFDHDKRLKQEAKEVVEKLHMTEAEKIEAGWHWITTTDRGITIQKLVKPT